MIGIVEETDDETGEVLSLKTVCSSINNHAAELSGPTDTQLTGAWKCELKKKKKTSKRTNYVNASGSHHTYLVYRDKTRYENTRVLR